MEDLTPQELLLGAVDYLMENGWHQGSSYDYTVLNGRTGGDFTLQEQAVIEGVPACALGSISAALLRHYGRDGYSSPQSSSAYYAAEQLLVKEFRERFPHLVNSDGWLSIPTVNDRPDTTAEDVILAMKSAATKEH